MLSIKLIGNPEPVIWYAGQKFAPASFDPSHVEWVQADGHELDGVIATVQNIPVGKTNIMVWYGDTAKSIAWVTLHRNS